MTEYQSPSSSQPDEERAPNGQFPQGVSGNPAGRPKGSKNKVTLLKLMAEEAVREKSLPKMLQVADLIVEQALEGDKDSQKLVWQAIMSKGSVDDRTQAQEKVTIQIGSLREEKGVTINQEDDSDEADD